MVTTPTVRIGGRFQGPTGSGQGGWTAQRFAAHIDDHVSMALRAPVPLERDLDVVRDDEHDRWLLIDRTGVAPVTIMIAHHWHPHFPDTTPVSIEEARAARSRFAPPDGEHPVPFCFSCGIQHDSMRVHAGALDDGRYASDWTVPDWAVGPDGTVDPGVLWAAIDCTAAWYVCTSRGSRPALTAQYAVEVLQPIEPGATYALVGWAGDHPADWDGRKRHAASTAFAADGTCVARSTSFWIAPRHGEVSDTRP
jgi:hypothetical protein